MAPNTPLLTLTLLIFIIISFNPLTSSQTIQKGFSISPNSPSSFQPILTDSTSTFSFGFLIVANSSSLVDLVVLHLPSSFPLWHATTSSTIPRSPSTSLSFDGSRLLLAGPSLIWSTPKVNASDALLQLLPSSNLRIIQKSQSQPLWQSFDFPSDSIIQNQNLTSGSALVSTNGLYSLRLGPTYLALHMEYKPGWPMYWKHTAMQIRAQIVEGAGPLYARVDPTGFLGLYQTDRAPVDVISFDTFNAGTPQALRRLTLEPDGNLKAYYFNNGSGSWVTDFVAISDFCSLPAPCGPYGLCNVDHQNCSGCLDNQTVGSTCSVADSGDFCSLSGGNGFQVDRVSGVDLANKELIGFEKMGSLEECEGLCEGDCSCWGAIYNNVSGYCYRIWYPVQTVLAMGDEKKVGYFKVRNGNVGGGGEGRRRRAGLVLLVLGVLVIAGGCGFAGYRVWKERRSSREDEMGMVMPPYKDLNSSSFRSVEMSSNSFRK